MKAYYYVINVIVIIAYHVASMKNIISQSFVRNDSYCYECSELNNHDIERDICSFCK